jgi:Amt family ammonium transporter
MVGAAVVGVVAGAVCSFAVGWKFRFGYDDSLDVVGVHLVGGIVGTLLIGLLATQVMTGGVEGLLYGGGFVQLGKQALAVAVVGLYAFGITYGLGKLIDRWIGFRVTAEQETSGIDLALHAESAYEHAVLAHGTAPGLFSREHERPRPEPEADEV